MPKPISVATATMGARIRARREDQGLSQEALAERSGVHWTFLGQVERGQRNLSLHNLLKRAAGLSVDPAELVGASRLRTALLLSLLGGPRGEAEGEILRARF
jgi:transcriptional regulator with XRE-family HTH domain